MPCVQVHFNLIGMNIRILRQQRQLTQEQLAERAGISYKFLGNLERGKGVPSVITLLSLCDALSVSPDALLKSSFVHDPCPPCTLRDDHTVYDHTLTDQLFPQEGEIFISLDDLPAVDITLPDDEND